MQGCTKSKIENLILDFSFSLTFFMQSIFLSLAYFHYFWSRQQIKTFTAAAATYEKWRLTRSMDFQIILPPPLLPNPDIPLPSFLSLYLDRYRRSQLQRIGLSLFPPSPPHPPPPPLLSLVVKKFVFLL